MRWDDYWRFHSSQNYIDIDIDYSSLFAAVCDIFNETQNLSFHLWDVWRSVPSTKITNKTILIYL